MLGFFKRKPALPVNPMGAKPPLDKPAEPLPKGLTIELSKRRNAAERSHMATAEWHAFQSQMQAEAGDLVEARAHLVDAAEFLIQHGGPLKFGSAEEVYQWCARRRALEG